MVCRELFDKLQSNPDAIYLGASKKDKELLNAYMLSAEHMIETMGDIFFDLRDLDDEGENEALKDTEEYFENFYCDSKEKADLLMRIQNVSLKKILEGAQTKSNWRFTKYLNLFD
jgi:hypothetical protein